MRDAAHFVTGGSRGIGRAICIELARAGASVAVNYNASEDAAREVVAAIEAEGGVAAALPGDIAESRPGGRARQGRRR